MVYNKTKRTLELIAGIFGLVGAISMLAVSIYLFYMGIAMLAILAEEGVGVGIGVVYLIFGIIELATTICQIVFSAMVIPSPVKPEGVLRTTKRRVCLIIFSFLCGNFITFGLEIAVMCIKDFVSDAPAAPKAQYITYPQAQPQPQPQPLPQYEQPASIDTKVRELKHLKELGVIDESTYKKAIEKIIKEA